MVKGLSKQAKEDTCFLTDCIPCIGHAIGFALDLCPE